MTAATTLTFMIGDLYIRLDLPTNLQPIPPTSKARERLKPKAARAKPQPRPSADKPKALVKSRQH